MKRIECTIKRKAGSSVTLGANTYRWNDANGHVCDVADEHAQVLLAVPESFREMSAAAASGGGQPDSEAGDSASSPAGTDGAEEKPARKKPGRKPKAVAAESSGGGQPDSEAGDAAQ